MPFAPAASALPTSASRLFAGTLDGDLFHHDAPAQFGADHGVIDVLYRAADNPDSAASLEKVNGEQEMEPRRIGVGRAHGEAFVFDDGRVAQLSRYKWGTSRPARTPIASGPYVMFPRSA